MDFLNSALWLGKIYFYNNDHNFRLNGPAELTNFLISYACKNVSEFQCCNSRMQFKYAS